MTNEEPATESILFDAIRGRRKVKITLNGSEGNYYEVTPHALGEDKFNGTKKTAATIVGDYLPDGRMLGKTFLLDFSGILNVIPMKDTFEPTSEWREKVDLSQFKIKISADQGVEE